MLKWKFSLRMYSLTEMNRLIFNEINFDIYVNEKNIKII
jgi:hypothetical protein